MPTIHPATAVRIARFVIPIAIGRNEKMKKDSVACWKEIDEITKSEHWIGGGK